MKKKNIFILVLYILSISILHAQWNYQPRLELDRAKNITYIDPVGGPKAIFPVMLFSFIADTEDDIPTDSLWYETKDWGFNIIWTWGSADNTWLNANQFEIITNLRTKPSQGHSQIYALYDEPIAHGKVLDELVTQKANRVVPDDTGQFLWYVGFSLEPYYYRSVADPVNPPFASKLSLNQGSKTFSTASYIEVAGLAEIIAFDYYPFIADGTLRTDDGGHDSGKTVLVGEFTRILKNQFPNKSVWTVIQTLPFWGYNSTSYQHKIINDSIIRHLTFSAIINGADGIAFYGQDQFNEPKSLSGEAISDEENSIWNITLRQTVELKELQSNKYDEILLSDNINGYPIKNKYIEYSFKKVKNSNKYYVFATNLSYTTINTKIEIIKGFHLIPKQAPERTIESIGKYTIRAESSTEDYRNPNALGEIALDGTYFYSNFEPHGVNIFSFELEELNLNQ